jgi:hypothetical protein
MATINPFADDPVTGDVWEQGFLAGHSEPEVDHLPPFSPELLDAFQQGESAGRDERRLLPPAEGGDETSEGGLAEVAEEVGLHALGHYAFEKLFGAIGGLIALVITVVQIPGDVQLRPLEPDWEGAADQPDEQYVALCPRIDHPLAQVGVTQDGYWTGLAQPTYADALSEAQGHGHSETVVCRVSVQDATCGAVWPGKSN